MSTDEGHVLHFFVLPLFLAASPYVRQRLALHKHVHVEDVGEAHVWLAPTERVWLAARQLTGSQAAVDQRPRLSSDTKASLVPGVSGERGLCWSPHLLSTKRSSHQEEPLRGSILRHTGRRPTRSLF